jgi:hypothetical protein
MVSVSWIRLAHPLVHATSCCRIASQGQGLGTAIHAANYRLSVSDQKLLSDTAIQQHYIRDAMRNYSSQAALHRQEADHGLIHKTLPTPRSGTSVFHPGSEIFDPGQAKQLKQNAKRLQTFRTWIIMQMRIVII